MWAKSIHIFRLENLVLCLVEGENLNIFTIYNESKNNKTTLFLLIWISSFYNIDKTSRAQKCSDFFESFVRDEMTVVFLLSSSIYGGVVYTHHFSLGLKYLYL